MIVVGESEGGLRTALTIAGILLRMLYVVGRTFPKECSKAREEALQLVFPWMKGV